jgi:uncharacterized protein YjiS (DUF1127 family)
MVIGQIWINANPELRGHLRTANEARSAAYYANWRAVTAPFRGLVEALRRVRRERETYGRLSRLNDRQLKDIGISRSEIGSIAQTVAAEPPEAGLTIAELRQIRQTAPAVRDAHVVSLPHADQRRSRGGSRAAPQTPAAASAERDRVAS